MKSWLKKNKRRCFNWMFLLVVIYFIFFTDLTDYEQGFTRGLVVLIFLVSIAALYIKTPRMHKVLIILETTIWIILFCFAGLLFYVNHYMPHGPMYDSGQIVCENDDRGPCGEQYLEYMGDLNIPNWAKEVREDGIGIVIMLGLSGLILASKRIKNNE